MKNIGDLAAEYADQTALGRAEQDFAEYKADLRLAFYAGYDAGLLFASRAVREVVDVTRAAESKEDKT